MKKLSGIIVFMFTVVGLCGLCFEASAELWTPSDMDTVVGWYDAADSSNLWANTAGTTPATTTVALWKDKSGNSNNITQTTGASQPTIADTIGGLNAIEFDGTDDKMLTASNPFGATINNAFVIAVHKVNAIDKGIFFSLTSSDDAAKRWQSHAPWAGGTLYFDVGGVASPERISASYNISVDDNVLVTYYGSATDNVKQVYKNGSLLVGNTSGESVTTAGGICVGSYANAGVPDACQATSIGEFIVINGTVTTDDRQRLEGYLAWKWGLEGQLPSGAGHPYSGAPPEVGDAGTPVASGTFTVSTDLFMDSDGTKDNNTTLLAGRPGTASTKVRRAFLQFDLSELGSDSISNAVLRLYHIEGYGDTYANASLYAVTSSWTYENVIFEQPVGTSLGILVNSAGPFNQYIEFDVTDLVKGWQTDPTSNYGFSIRGNEINTLTGKYFVSSEGSVAQRPEMLVRYVATPKGTMILIW